MPSVRKDILVAKAGHPKDFFNGKFNPNHDELGRFTFGGGGGAGDGATGSDVDSSEPATSLSDRLGTALQGMLGVGSAEAQEIDPTEDETRGPADTDPLAEARIEAYQNSLETLRQLDPNNRQLESISGPNWVPTNEDISTINQAIVDASNRRVTDFAMPGEKPVGSPGGGWDIRTLSGSDTTAQNDFEYLTVGGQLGNYSTYPGVMVDLPGGGVVGYRPISSHGLPTIDFDTPLVPFRSIHYK